MHHMKCNVADLCILTGLEHYNIVLREYSVLLNSMYTMIPLPLKKAKRGKEFWVI